MHNDYCDLPNAYEIFINAYFMAKENENEFDWTYPSLAAIIDTLYDKISELETDYVILEGEKHNAHRLFSGKEEDFLSFLGLQYYNYKFELVEPLSPPILESKQLNLVRSWLSGEDKEY